MNTKQELSTELKQFMKVPKETKMSRTELSSWFYNYFKDNKLFEYPDLPRSPVKTTKELVELLGEPTLEFEFHGKRSKHFNVYTLLLYLRKHII